MRRLLCIVPGAQALAVGLVLAGCQTVGDTDADASAAYDLSGTDWMLIEYGGTLDSPGQEVPPNKYTLSLEADGNAAFRLDCNYATTSWQATPSGPEGGLSFGLIAATIALCPDGSIGEEVARDMGRVTEYALYDGRLTMTLGDEGITYVWDRID